MNTLVAAFLLALAFVYVAGYPSGAPLGSCDKMVPKHNSSVAQNSICPFTIDADPTEVAAGTPITITVTGTSNFAGYIMRAFDAKTNKFTPGNFDITPSSANGKSQAKTLKCTEGFEDGVTHVSKDPKKSVTVEWTAPPGFSGDVFFRATVVRDFVNWWSNCQSNTITLTP